jgi:hypothetical protein
MNKTTVLDNRHASNYMRWWKRLIYGVILPLLCSPLAVLILLIVFSEVTGERLSGDGSDPMRGAMVIGAFVVWCCLVAASGLLPALGFALFVRLKTRTGHFAWGLGLFLAAGAVAGFVIK